MHEKFMEMAIRLAENAGNRMHPNPRVGAVIVKNGQVVGKGFHGVYGGKHAEVNAIENAKGNLKEATLYCTLEPCGKYGKQPPCAHAIVEAGIKEVFIAQTGDPDQKGSGINYLKQQGVNVHTGLLSEKAAQINKEFFKYAKTKTPFFLVKCAISLDGKLTYGNGKAKKITSKESKEKTIELRKKFQAILVGKNTVFLDNPRLDTREKNTSPIRIILCADARLPLNAKVFSKIAPTIVVCTKKAKKVDVGKLLKKGVGVIIAKEKNGQVDLKSLEKELGLAGVSSVLVEAGQQVFTSFLKEKIFDEIILAVSPCIFGEGKSFVQDEKIFASLKINKTEMVGPDLWIYLSKN